MSKPKSYIGVTGFMSREEVEAVLPVLGDEAERLLMVGVLGSQKTMLLGEANRWPGRYPTADRIAAIFPDDPHCLNLIHYNTKDPESLYDQLVQATEIAGQNCHGFQLNLRWPWLPELRRYRGRHPDKKIVLQVGSKAMQFVDDTPMTPREIASKIANYFETVDYILLDPSGGYGIPFDADKLLGILNAMHQYDLHHILGSGVAGGLSAGTIGILKPVISRYPDISIDAEGKLRDMPADTLNLDSTRAYVAAALALFKACT